MDGEKSPSKKSKNIKKNNCQNQQNTGKNNFVTSKDNKSL